MQQICSQSKDVHLCLCLFAPCRTLLFPTKSNSVLWLLFSTPTWFRSFTHSSVDLKEHSSIPRLLYVSSLTEQKTVLYRYCYITKSKSTAVSISLCDAFVVRSGSDVHLLSQGQVFFLNPSPFGLLHAPTPTHLSYPAAAPVVRHWHMYTIVYCTIFLYMYTVLQLLFLHSGLILYCTTYEGTQVVHCTARCSALVHRVRTVEEPSTMIYIGTHINNRLMVWRLSVGSSTTRSISKIRIKLETVLRVCDDWLPPL